MSRLIFLFAIVALIYLLIKSYRKEAPRGAPKVVEDMLRCARCGVHIPASESIRADGEVYCCEAHRNSGRK